MIIQPDEPPSLQKSLLNHLCPSITPNKLEMGDYDQVILNVDSNAGMLCPTGGTVGNFALSNAKCHSCYSTGVDSKCDFQDVFFSSDGSMVEREFVEG